MDVKKFVLGALAAALTGFVLSGLWHVLLFADFYESAAAAPRDPPLFWAVCLGYLVVGCIMAYMYPKGYEGGSPAVEGFKFGAVIGLLWWFPTQLVLYGAMEGPASLIWVDGGWHVIEQGVSGVALAMVYGREEPGA